MGRVRIASLTENVCANGEEVEVGGVDNAEDGDRDGDEVVAKLEVAEKVVGAADSEVKVVDRLLISVVRTVDEVSDKLKKSVKEAEEVDEPKEDEETNEADEVDEGADEEEKVSTEVEDDGADVVAEVGERLWDPVSEVDTLVLSFSSTVGTGVDAASEVDELGIQSQMSVGIMEMYCSSRK